MLSIYLPVSVKMIICQSLSLLELHTPVCLCDYKSEIALKKKRWQPKFLIANVKNLQAALFFFFFLLTAPGKVSSATRVKQAGRCRCAAELPVRLPLVFLHSGAPDVRVSSGSLTFRAAFEC